MRYAGLVVVVLDQLGAEVGELGVERLAAQMRADDRDSEVVVGVGGAGSGSSPKRGRELQECRVGERGAHEGHSEGQSVAPRARGHRDRRQDRAG